MNVVYYIVCQITIQDNNVKRAVFLSVVGGTTYQFDLWALVS